MRSSYTKDMAILFLAWLVMIAFDFFLHAGVLAGLYSTDSPFLLPAEVAFRRIPVGYLSFFILGLLLFWLVKKVQINTRMNGLIFGLVVGCLTWGALVLGLFSISTASPGLLIGWWLGQTIELGLAGFVFGADREGVKQSKILRWAFFFLLGMIVLTFILQATELAPPMKTIQ